MNFPGPLSIGSLYLLRLKSQILRQVDLKGSYVHAVNEILSYQKPSKSLGSCQLNYICFSSLVNERLVEQPLSHH